MPCRPEESRSRVDRRHPGLTIVALAALLALGLHAAAARGDDSGAPTFLFSGFGTFSVVHSSEKNADFTSTNYKPSGAGYSRNWSADVDTLLGAQVTAAVTPQLSVVVQIITEQNYQDSWRPHVEWANINYQFTPNLTVRIGRTVLPMFMVADSRKIGYANYWLRPPIEVYNLAPVSSNDGIDASYRMHVGTATNTLQVTAGRTDTSFPGVTAQTRALVNFVDTFEHEFTTVRLNYGRAKSTIPEFASLFDGFRQFGPEGAAIADRYTVTNRPVTFFGIGASYDPGDFFVIGEWSTSRAEAVLGTKSGWYLSGGYRFGKFTPYVTYGRAKGDNLSDPGLTVSALPAFLAVPATALNDALNAILRNKIVQNTFSIGTRWDFMPNAALKLQFDHTRIGAGSTGELSNTQPDFRLGGKVDLFSASIDFVF
jgi:hypothetical protein